MKKIYSFISLLTLISLLSSCKTEEVVNVVYDTAQVDLITKVEVPVEVYVEKYPETKRIYTPGTYVNYEVIDGDTIYTNVVIDDYGQISSVYLDKFIDDDSYYIDEENNLLYIYIPGIKDVIPNTYRLIKDENIPDINTSIKSDDLIEGYPEYDEVIKKLTKVENATALSIKDTDFQEAMQRVSNKIIEDQTTYSILLYEAGDITKVVNVEDIDYDISIYLELLEETLIPLLLEKDDLTREVNKAYHGLYKPGTYYNSSAPLIKNEELYYVNYLVVIDEYGQISSVNIDEIIKHDGVNTLRSVVDEKFSKNIEILENKIKNNQGINAFTYKEELNLEKDGLAYEEENFIENISIEWDVTSYIDLVSKTEDLYLNNYSLVAGTYYNYYEDYVMTMTVDNSKNIVALTLDKLASSDNAKIKIDEEEFELYTYEKVYYIDIFEEETSSDIYYIYKDKNEYYYATDYIDPHNFEEYEKGDKVTFNTDIFDEEKTVEAVYINATINSIDPSVFLEQSNLFTSFIVEKKSINSVDLENNHALNIEGLTIDLKDINYLLYDTYYLATESRNASYTNSLAVTKLNNQLQGYKLANGNYYMHSDLPYNGEYLTLTMSVYNNKVVSLVLDKTVYDYKQLFSANNKYNYSKLSQFYLNDITFNDLQTGLLDGYEYKIDDELEKDSDAISFESEMFIFNDALERALQDALSKRVYETIDEVSDYIIDAFLEDKNFIVASSEKEAGYLELDLTSLVKIGTNVSNNEEFLLEVDINDSKLLDVEEVSDYVYHLYSDAKDVLVSTVSNINYELSFDDASLEKEKSIKILSNDSYKKYILDLEKNDNLNQNNPYEMVTSGKEFLLEIEDYNNVRLGTESNNELMFMLTSSSDVKLSVNDNTNIEINYINTSDTYEITLSGITSYETSVYKLEVTSLTDYKIYNKDNLLVLEMISGVPVDMTKEEANKIIHKFQETMVLPYSSTVEVYSESEELEHFEIRAFFDNFDQDDEFISTYQKGEATRTYSFKVITSEEAIKIASKLAKYKMLNVEYIYDGEFDLLDTKDLQIDGIILVWDGYITSTNSKYNDLIINGFNKSHSNTATLVPGSTSTYVEALYYELIDDEKVLIDTVPVTGKEVSYQNIDSVIKLNAHPKTAIMLDLRLNVIEEYANKDADLKSDGVSIYNDYSNFTVKYEIEKEFTLKSMTFETFKDAIKVEFIKESEISIFYELTKTGIHDYDPTLPGLVPLNITLRDNYFISDEFDISLDVLWYYEGILLTRTDLSDILESKVVNLEVGDKVDVTLTAEVEYELYNILEKYQEEFTVTIYNNGN